MNTHPNLDSDLEAALSGMDLAEIKPSATRSGYSDLSARMQEEMSRRYELPSTKIAAERDRIKDELASQHHELQSLLAAHTVTIETVTQKYERMMEDARASIVRHENAIAELQKHIASCAAELHVRRQNYETTHQREISDHRKLIRGNERKLSELADDITAVN